MNLSISAYNKDYGIIAMPETLITSLESLLSAPLLTNSLTSTKVTKLYMKKKDIFIFLLGFYVLPFSIFSIYYIFKS